MSTGSDPDVAPDLEAGFTSVDAQPDPTFLISGMDQTAQWTAVKRLRAFEADRLDLAPGEVLLDVGCGVGDASMALAASVAPGGRVEGIDFSGAMVDEANRRAAAAGLPATYRTGDAMDLDEPDATYDACRSERMLQWVPEPATAIGEMIRVLKSGGRLSLIDTDWRTLTFDMADSAAFEAIRTGMLALRGEPALAGGRLLNICRDAGLHDLEIETAAHAWTSWNPETEPAPSGFFPIDTVFSQLADLGFVDRPTVEAATEQMLANARNDRFFMSVTMHAVAARKP